MGTESVHRVSAPASLQSPIDRDERDSTTLSPLSLAYSDPATRDLPPKSPGLTIIRLRTKTEARTAPLGTSHEPD